MERDDDWDDGSREAQRPRIGVIARAVVFGLAGLVVGAIGLWFAAGGLGSVHLIKHKDGILSAYEKNGIDTSECRRRKLSLQEPRAGMPDCLESSFRDIARKLNEPPTR